jgi:hypothetical protein
MQGPPPVPTDPRGRALRLVYPSRPVLDTAGTLSTNIRAGSKVGPQNDSSEKKREGRLAGAPGGASRGERGKHDRGSQELGLQKTTPTFLVALKADSGVMRDPLPDSTIYPSPVARCVKHSEDPPALPFAAHLVASGCCTGSVAVSVFGASIDAAVVVVVA